MNCGWTPEAVWNTWISITCSCSHLVFGSPVDCDAQTSGPQWCLSLRPWGLGSARHWLTQSLLSETCRKTLHALLLFCLFLLLSCQSGTSLWCVMTEGSERETLRVTGSTFRLEQFVFLFYQLKNGQRLFPPLPIIRRSCNKNRKGLNFWAAFDLYCPRTGRSVVKQNWRLIIFAHFERRPLLGAFPVCTVASRHPGHMTLWVLCLDLSVHVMRLQVFHTASGWLGEWNRTKIY